ncbi:hypothetical protein MYP14_16920 [Rhodococcus pyridinivorans]|uniref:hypothetical protein n=1 Tax=Rhodococcus TaxID=1827 RepID=UPI0011C3E391|nr:MULTISPECIES: hypothetical protein [Rhodococcus]UPK62465.1 hypothetical protein MYP14_16920 [Rhodococcus pyridinivorans]
MLSVTSRQYFVELALGVHPAPPFKSLDDVEERIIDPLLDAFEGVEGPEDVDLGFDLSTGTLSISMVVEADSQAHALEDAVAAARTAIHATGGHTPEWDEIADLSEDHFASTVRPAELVDC